MSERSDAEEQYVSVAEAADIVGVSKKLIRRWIHEEGLPATNLGGRRGFVIARTALDRFLVKRNLTTTIATQLATSRV